MYNPQELQRKAQLNLHGVDNYAQTNIETNPPKEENEQSGFVRGLATVGNFFVNVAEGAIKSIEGIVDAGAMLVGLFGADVDDFVSWDITSDVFGTDEEGEGLLDWAWGRNLSDVSYLDDSSIVNQIAEGIGGMLPTIGLAALSGGTSLAGTAAAKVLKVASKVGFIAGASGNAAESALQEGASFGQAFSYGAISGAIEGVTEKIGGRVFGETSARAVDKTLLGKGLAKIFGEKAITKGAGKVAYNFVSEGLEEVVADLLDPLNKRITGVDTEAKVNWSELPKTFFVGGAVGSVLEGVQNAGSAIAHRKEGGKHYTKIANDLQNIADYQKGLAVLQGSKEVTQEQLYSAIVKNSERTLDYLEDISTELKAMTEEQRANALKTLGENSSYISELYEKDGSLKSDAYDTYSEVINEGGKGYNVSTNLLYKKKEVEGKLVKINEEDSKNFELSDATFNEKERKNFAKINRNITKLSNITGTNLELVVIKEHEDANAFIKGSTIYVGEDVLSNGTWARYLSHEITHFARDSKEFKNFAEYVTKDTEALEKAILEVDKNYKYGYSVETAKQIVNNVQSGSKNVTKTELAFYDEVVAHITEELFQSEKSIKSFARENTTLAQKILNKIREFLSIFKGTNADSETVVNLRRAEMLFERALRSMGKEVEETTREATRIKSRAEKATIQYLKDRETYNNLTEDEKAKWLEEKGYKAEDFADDVLGEDNTEDIDNTSQIRYAKKRVARYINKSLPTPTISYIRNELKKLYGDLDNGIADGIAIEMDKTVYIVDSGIEDGNIVFGVREEIAIDDENLRNERLEKINDRAISKGFISSELLGKIRHTSDNNSNSSVERKLSKELSTNKRQSEDNKKRILEKDATDGSRRLKFSLKNSEKQELELALRTELRDFHEIKIEDENEYRKLEKEIKQRNGNHPSEFEWASTDRYLYIVRNNSINSFSPIIRIDTDKHSRLYKRLYRMIDLDNYSTEVTIIKWLDELYAHPNFYDWVNIDDFSPIESEIAVTTVDEKLLKYKEFDSKGRKLTTDQIEYFKRSHVRDRYGRLREVYHGTYKEFYIFAKALLGTNFSGDAKLGFFFTASRPLAGDYSENAKVIRKHRILSEIANGDEDILNYLSDKNNLDDYEKVKDYLDKDTYEELKEIDKKLSDNDNEVFSVYLNIENPYVENWERQAHYKTNMVRAIMKAKANGHDGVIIKRIDAAVTQGRPAADLYIVFEPNQIKLTTNKKPTKHDDIRYSKKITANMTDSERFDILKNKKIENIPVAKELTKEQLANIKEITSFDDLNKYFGAEKRNIIKKIASEFGVFKEYYNKDIELEFEFSKSNYNESYQKQKHNFVSYAKMFSVFDDVVEKAVGIEIHNRNLESYKFDPMLKNVYVLASAFVDGQSIVPVKLEIKEFNDKNNKLYVAIALDKIKKTEVLEDRDYLNKEVAHSSLSVNISIRDLLKNVNPNDKDFYKYIPKQFFAVNSKNEGLLLNDTDGETLTPSQREFFRNTKVLDENGNLQVVYHGTEGKFYTFDKSQRGSMTNTADAKLGFFFTTSKDLAHEYAVYSYDKKISELKGKIANGDKEILNKLSKLDGYKQLPQTKDVQEYGRLLEKGERFEHDVYKLYLNIENPLVEDLGGETYDAEKMLAIIKRALSSGNDGVIIKNMVDSFEDGDAVNDVFIVFEPNQIKLTTNKNPTKSKDIRFSRKSFSEQVDDVIGGADTTSTHLKVRDTTPKVFVDIGLDNKPMLITSVHTKTAVSQKVANKNIHSLSIETLKRLPKLLESPAIIMDSDKENSIVAFVDAVDTNNNPVLCAININGKGFYNNIRINTNLISSVYGKDTNPIGFIEKAVDENRVLYWNKKMSQDLFYIPGLQLPDNLLNLDSNIIIRKSKWIVNQNLKKPKFSLKENTTYTLSDGQVKKKVADITKKKVYTKKESQEIVNSIIGNIELGGGYYVLLRNNQVEQIADKLWKVLNTYDSGKRVKATEKIADYIIENAILENVFKDEQNQADVGVITILKPYLHNLNLDGIKEEIKFRYGKTNASVLLWGKRNGEDGYTADQVAELLKEDGIYLESINEADLFFEMDKLYRDAVRNLKSKKNELWNKSLHESERTEIRNDIRNELLRAFDENGSQSKLAKIIETYSNKAKVWKDLYYEEKTRNKSINSLLEEIEKLKKLEEFNNATQFKTEQFKGSIEGLERLDWRGNLNESGARKIVSVLNSWYNIKNEVVGPRFEKEISDTLTEISNGNDKLNSSEIQELANIVSYFRHFIENHTKIYRNKQWVDQIPVAESYVNKIQESSKIKLGMFGNIFYKVMSTKYAKTFADPMALARHYDKYDDGGFFTETMESFRDGEMNSAILQMELNAPVVEFLHKHKSYSKKLKKQTIIYRGVKIPLSKAISLYMTLNRDHAVLGFVKSGFEFEDQKGNTVIMEGIETRDDLAFDDYKMIAKKEQSELHKQFDKNDLEFIKIVEKIFNEDCRDKKKERDEQMRGYSNVVDGYYFPIRRANISKDIDDDFFGGDRVGNESFNKSTVKGAQQSLLIDSIEDVFTRHTSAIARYYHLANVIQNFNIIYNLDISGNSNAPLSVKLLSKNEWKDGYEYIQKLLEDMKGVKKGDGSGIFGFLRKGFVKFQFGANPKVSLTQLSSLITATIILDYGSIRKGFVIKNKDIDKYCKLAELRNTDKVAVKSQGVIDDIDKIGNLLTKHVNAADRFGIRVLFGACQSQVQKDSGLKIGTEENKVKAGELLKKVIFETQQNNLATERSSAMRSSSEILKSLTMFTADSMKVWGRVMDAYGKVVVLKARLRIAKGQNEIVKLKQELKKANLCAVKSTTALVVQAVYMALLAQLFKKFYNKDDEDEEVISDMTVDFFGNMLGGLPILEDVYSKLFEGYDFNSFAFSSLNNLFEAVGSLTKMTSGDSREVASSIRKMSYALGQLFGIPTRNIYNVFYGTSNLISPEFAYKMSDSFYKQSYKKDLKKAIANEDEDMINTIAGLIMNENVGAFDNSATRTEINRLVGLGYDVLPQSTPNSVTINEEEYSLDNKQKSEFKKVYEQSISDINKLVSSNGYKIAPDEAKSKAIKYIYRYYYYEAQASSLNAELDTKLYLFGNLIPIEKMALALAEAPIIAEKSKDKKKAVQRYLQGLKLNATQKTMLMGYFGYSIKNSESSVKNLVNKSNLTKKQKRILLEKCGY